MDVLGMQESHEELGNLVEEYQLAGIDNCNELAANFTMQTIFNVLVDCINSRSIGKFSMIMGVIEGDWLKINKSPEALEAYERSLETLRDAKE